jgi:hypothetical protein
MAKRTRKAPAAEPCGEPPMRRFGDEVTAPIAAAGASYSVPRDQVGQVVQHLIDFDDAKLINVSQQDPKTYLVSHIR